jgi:hypothetical protein
MQNLFTDSPRSDECSSDSECFINGTFVVGTKATLVVRLRANPKPYQYHWTDGENELDSNRFKQLQESKLQGVCKGLFRVG